MASSVSTWTWRSLRISFSGAHANPAVRNWQKRLHIYMKYIILQNLVKDIQPPKKLVVVWKLLVHLVQKDLRQTVGVLDLANCKQVESKCYHSWNSLPWFCCSPLVSSNKWQLKCSKLGYIWWSSSQLQQSLWNLQGLDTRENIVHTPQICWDIENILVFFIIADIFLRFVIIVIVSLLVISYHQYFLFTCHLRPRQGC